MKWRHLMVFLPGGLWFSLCLAVIRSGALTDWPPETLRYLPWGVWLAGLALGLLFHRTRLLYAILVLAIADALLTRYVPGALAGEASARIARAAVATLVPLNFLWLAWAREAGLWSAGGITRLLLVLIQAPVLALLYAHHPETVSAWFTQGPPAWFPHGIGPLPFPALAAFLLAYASVLTAYARRQDAIEAGFFWCLTLALPALGATSVGAATPLFLAGAGAVLVFSVVQISHRMAYRDELTGLPARRALNEYAASLGARYAVAMVDIDHFKRVNDRYGHDVGDQVLRMVAGRLSRVAGGGKPFRYGGEEFAVIFPGKNVKTTLDPVEDLRQSVAGARFVLRGRDRPRRKPDAPKPPRAPGRDLTVTISIGVAERTDKTNRFEAVIKAADKALYRAKKAGRNRVCPKR